MYRIPLIRDHSVLTLNSSFFISIIILFFFFWLLLQWRHELEDILVVALNDSEAWVSMLAETMRTLPSTGSLNLEIRHNDDNQRIFSDLVNDLRKLGNTYLWLICNVFSVFVLLLLLFELTL